MRGLTVMEDERLFVWTGSMHEQLQGAKTKKEKIARLIDVVKHLPINGCITGSCWLPGFDPDAWGTCPDVDLFVYNEVELIRACSLAVERLHMQPGKGTDRTNLQEQVKLDLLNENGLNKKFGITTYTFYCDDVMLNITFKQERLCGKWVPITNAPSVLMSFDMSIIMQGYDIKTHTFFDMRPNYVDDYVAVPNPLRSQEAKTWNVAKWTRQFDRVVKYYDRGYDTRPVAKFYVDLIDKCIEIGAVFDSDANQASFEGFAREFIVKREQIQHWLKEHEDD